MLKKILFYCVILISANIHASNINAKTALNCIIIFDIVLLYGISYKYHPIINHTIPNEAIQNTNDHINDDDDDDDEINNQFELIEARLRALEEILQPRKALK